MNKAKKIVKEKYIIDAAGQKLGRVATEAAVLLMGKNAPSYARNKALDVDVEIVNASKLSIHSEKKKSKEYIRYTGYPGGLRKESMERLLVRRGYEEVMRRAVYGMLPGNRLRAKRMKNLIVKN